MPTLGWKPGSPPAMPLRWWERLYVWALPTREGLDIPTGTRVRYKRLGTARYYVTHVYEDRKVL